MNYREGVDEAKANLEHMSEFDVWAKAQTMLTATDKSPEFRAGYYFTVSMTLEGTFNNPK